MSDSINSSGDNPVRPSHSGSHPAPGASRTKEASSIVEASYAVPPRLEIVDWNAFVDGNAMNAVNTAAEIFIFLCLV